MWLTVATAVEPEAASSLPMLALLFSIALALTHIYAGRLRFLDQVPRSRWLSMASGISVAYVFVHLLPELGERQAAFSAMEGVAFLEHHVYLVALLGLAAFYGLERLVTESRERNQEAGQEDTAEIGIFWLHMASFALYNGLIGYLLVHREEASLKSLFFFFIAMALHFVVNDFGLRQDHKNIYNRYGRWILASAIVVGLLIGIGTTVDEAVISILFAFLAGGVVLNVLKEELPEERKSRFWAFAAGAAVYAGLLLSL